MSKKIINIIESLDKNWGGPSRSVPQVCEALASNSCSITILTKKSPNPVSVKTNSYLKVRFYGALSMVLYLLRVDKGGVDLIHIQHIWHLYTHLAARIARLRGIPYMVTTRGMLEPWVLSRNSLKKRIALFLYQRKDLERARCIHVTSYGEAENIRKMYANDKIVLIPNGVNLNGIPYKGVFHYSKRLVFISRIHPKKGLEKLISAWSLLNEHSWTLEIAGEGDLHYIDGLIRQINEQKLSNIKLVGPKYGAEKWKFLELASASILPTYSENFGIVVAESLAMGVPVITTTGTPWSELQSENCGWWIDLSVENLQKTLKELMSLSESKLEEMGRNGRSLVEQKYQVQDISRRVGNMYDMVIQNEGLSSEEINEL